jgi:hypothetical protein
MIKECVAFRGAGRKFAKSVSDAAFVSVAVVNGNRLEKRRPLEFSNKMSQLKK